MKDDVPFSYHLGKRLMLLVVDNMEEKWLRHTFDSDLIIAHVQLL